ncbi:DUF885 domain-containing protein [Hyphococcus luteus]|uniref:DUF885 domain-containing protein n=1 Tax=Hyphococcus luteus TaxID=2058213 RepID=A0A2S7K9J3_9PROT|nr:DUF885 domain-containing protein [Marinicaulis flavus]PQA89162.1 DUF885 domain-containing protein [Marinicaulis flavus]
MRFTILLAMGAALLAGCGGQEPASHEPAAVETAANDVAAETERLNQWFAARYEEELDFSPITRTFQGDKKDYDKIDDMSEEGQDAQLEWRRETVEDLKANFDRAKLTPEAQTSYDVWIDQYERAAAEAKFRRSDYVFTQMNGPQAFLAQFLIAFHKVDDASDMEAYIARIGGVSRALGQLLDTAQLNAEAGVRPPLFAYESVIEQARGLITGAPFEGEGDSPVWADAKAKIDAMVEAGTIDESKADDLKERAKTALLEDWAPAYQELIDWFEEDKANAATTATGVGSNPNGEAYYKMRLANSTTTDMRPEEVHQLGLSEVERIHAEMEAIKESVGFEGTLQEFFKFIREDEQFFYPNTDEGRQAYIDAATAHINFIKEKLPDYFGILPKADLVVKRVEPFREQPGAAQHYFPGTPDGSRPGVYYAHLIDMTAMPTPELEVIAYHEGIPGHHMQISIAQELTSVPKFRTQAGYTAYAEGWGLYAEKLAKEMGAYKDPYSDFGRLSSEIWRAIRLVVDTGLHAKGWTEEEAVQYMSENSSISEGQIRSEVRRYIVLPGQATAYKVGMLKILELRAKAKAELGDKFDIRGFHDTVLGGGALPLDILERRVDDWVADQKDA